MRTIIKGVPIESRNAPTSDISDMALIVSGSVVGISVSVATVVLLICTFI